MKVILDFDDFSPNNTSMGLLEEIKEHYPEFKVTLFSVPWEVRFSTPTNITEYIQLADGTKERKFKAFIEACKEYRDWIEIAVHGLTHTPEEFLNASYDEAKKRIIVAEKLFINVGIPYTKIFKAPFWQLSEAGKKAAEDLGFRVAEDHYYNWNLKDDLTNQAETDVRRKVINKNLDTEDYLMGHGHIQITSGNGLEEVIHRIYKLPTDTKFTFLSEWFESDFVDPAKIDFRDPLKRFKVLEDGKEIL